MERMPEWPQLAIMDQSLPQDMTSSFDWRVA
jgi:hypothetical protein